MNATNAETKDIGDREDTVQTNSNKETIVIYGEDTNHTNTRTETKGAGTERGQSALLNPLY